MPNKPSGRPSRFLVEVEPVIRAALLGAGGKSRRVAPTARRGANDAPTAESRQGASLVLALNEALLLQALAEFAQALSKPVRRGAVEEPDHRHRRLLRVCRRPSGHRTTEEHDEFAPSHVEFPAPETSRNQPCQPTARSGCRGSLDGSLG